MRVRGSALVIYLLCVTVGVTGLWLVNHRPSPARGARADWRQGAGTNGQARLRNRELQTMEEQLRKSFRGLSPEQVLEGTLGPYPTPAPAPPSRTTRDLLDRKKNWTFLTPEELAAGAGGRNYTDLLQPETRAESAEKRSTAMERYMSRMEAKERGARSDALPEGDWSTSSRANGGGKSARAEDGRTAALNQSEYALRKAMGGEDLTRGSLAAEPRLFGETFNFRAPKDFVDSDSHRDRMKDYRAWLDAAIGGSPVAADSLPGQGGRTPAGGYTPANPFSEPTRPFDSGPGATLNANTLNPRLPEVGARTLNQWNPLYEPPKIETPKPPPPSVPRMEAPRRKFF